MSKTTATTPIQRINLLLERESDRVKAIAAGDNYYVKIFDDKGEVAFSFVFPISTAGKNSNFIPQSAKIYSGDVSDELLDSGNIYTFRNILRTKDVDENILNNLLSSIENPPTQNDEVVATSSREYGELLAKDRGNVDFAIDFAKHKNDKSAKCQDAVYADVFTPTSEFTTKQARTLLNGIVSEARKRIIDQDEEIMRHNGSTFCGVAVIAGEKPEDAEIVISNLGDSRAYLVLVDKKGNEVLVSLSDDAELDKKRFKQKLQETGARIDIDVDDQILRVCDENGNPSVNMAAALGDRNIPGLIEKPEYTTISLRNILESKQFEGFTAKRVIVATDGVTKLEGYEGYPVDHYKPIVAGKYGEPKITGWKRVRGNDPANSLFGRITGKQPPKQEITAQSRTRRTQEHLTYDDVSASEIRLDLLQKGQVAVAVACDGHGTRKEGHLISQALADSARELVGKEKEQALFAEFFQTNNSNKTGKIFTFDNNQYAIIPPDDKYPDYMLVKAVRQKTADGQVKTATVEVEPEEQKKVLEEIAKQVKENNQKKTPQTQPQKNVGYWTEHYGIKKERGAVKRKRPSDSAVGEVEEKRRTKEKDSTHERD